MVGVGGSPPLQSRDQPAAPWAHLAPQHPYLHHVAPLTGLKWGDSSGWGDTCSQPPPAPYPGRIMEIQAEQLLDQGGVGVRGPRGRGAPFLIVRGGGRCGTPFLAVRRWGPGSPFLAVRGRGGSRAPFLAVRSPLGNPAISPQLPEPGQGHAGAGGRGAAPGGAGGRLHGRRVSAGGARAAPSERPSSRFPVGRVHCVTEAGAGGRGGSIQGVRLAL